MKKLLSITFAIVSVALVLSSCKKDDKFTDSELAEKIAAYQTYSGQGYLKGAEDDIAYLVCQKAAGSREQIFALTYEGDLGEQDPLPEDIFAEGTWEVKEGNLILHVTKNYGEPVSRTISGPVKDSGKKLSLASGDLSYELEYVKVK